MINKYINFDEEHNESALDGMELIQWKYQNLLHVMVRKCFVIFVGLERRKKSVVQ